MNIIKSMITILVLVAAAVGLYQLGRRWLFGQSAEHKVGKVLCFALAFVVVAVLYVSRWEYAYPFERKVDLELYAVIEITEEDALSDSDWYAIYEKWGAHPGSKWMDTESVSAPFIRYGFDWPNMDFENHTYIVSYGQELVSLTYNV